MNLSELINEILSEWAYRVDDGQPNPKNEKHLAQLSIVLSEMGLSDIKAELFENITEADKNFTNPILNKEIPYKGADGTQKKGIVGNLLRLPKDSEGRKAAEKLMPPEGSDERDSAMQDLGSEKDGKSTGGDKEKGKEDEKGKEGEKEKGAGEEEKAKAAAAMFDPKSDPAMGARMDREKAANDKLAQKDKEDSEAEKAPTPGSPEDWKNKADKVAKDKEEANKNGYDDSLHAMSDDQLDKAKYEAEQKMHLAQKSGDAKTFDKARIEYQQHKIEKEMRGAKSAGDKQIANSMSVDFQKRKAAYEEKYGEPYEADIPYPDSDGGERTSAKWGGEEPTGPEAGPNAEPPANEPSKPDTTPPTDAEEPKDGEEPPAALGDKPEETKIDKTTAAAYAVLDKAEQDLDDIELLKKLRDDFPSLFNNMGVDWDKPDPELVAQVNNTKDIRKKFKQNAEKAKTKEQTTKAASRLGKRKTADGEKLDIDTTPNGSLIIGVEHGDELESTKQTIQQIQKLPKGTKVMFVGEGGMSKDTDGNIQFGGEQAEIRDGVKEHFDNAEESSWDENANIEDDKAQVFKEIEKELGSPSKSRASIWTNMVGQGDNLKPNEYLDDEGKQWIIDQAKKAGATNITDKTDFNNLTDGEKKDLYELNYNDEGKMGDNEIMKGQEAYNGFRQKELDRKVKEAEDKGYTVIAPVGNSHVDMRRQRMKSQQKPEQQPADTKPEDKPKEEPVKPTDTKPEDKPEQQPADTKAADVKPKEPAKDEPTKDDETPKATKDDIKKEKPGKEAKTDSGGSLYSVGGGYYSDKPNGPAKYVRTESVIEMAFDNSLNEDVYALFEKSISGTLQNGEKITVQELPPRAVKKATQRAKAAAASSKEEPTQSPTSTEKPTEEPKGWGSGDNAGTDKTGPSSWAGMKTGWDGYEKPKGVDAKSTWDKTPMPKGETPPPGTKKAGGTPPPPPPPLPSKKTDGTDVPGKFTPIKNPPPPNEKGVEKDGKIAGTTIETEPALQNINPEFLKQKSTEMNKYYDNFKEDKKKAEGMAREKMGYSEEQVKGLKGEEKSAYDKEVKKNQQPTYNLCNVSLPNSNLFCSGNKGIPRAKMPQFTGEPVEGSQAWDVLQKAKETDPNETEANGQPYFRQMLADKGIKVTDAEVPSESLKATQTELVGDKVLGMKSVLDAGPSHPAYKKMTAPLYVSNDGYVVDGHHRWAAITAYNMEHPDNPLPLKTMIIDQPIDDAIETSNTFANEFGVAAKSGKQTGADAQKSEPQQPSSAKKGLSTKAKEAVVNIKNKTKDWADENKSFFKEKVHKGNSPERRSWGQAIKDKGLGAWEAIKKGAKHEVEEFKSAGMGAKNFFSGKPVSEHEKKALKAVGIKIAVTALTGAAFGGLSHGVAAFAKHVAIEFIPHTVAELIAGGVGKAALFAGDEEQDMDKMMEKFAGMIAEKMATADMDPEMMEKMVDSFNEKQNPKTEMKIESLIKEIIAEIVAEASTQSGDWKLAARKGGPKGKIVYFGSKEKKQAAISSGSHVDVDKNLNAKQGDTPTTPPAKKLGAADFRKTKEKELEPTNVTTDKPKLVRTPQELESVRASAFGDKKGVVVGEKGAADNDVKNNLLKFGYKGYLKATGKKPAPGSEGSAFNEIISGTAAKLLQRNPDVSEEELTRIITSQFCGTKLGKEQTVTQTVVKDLPNDLKKVPCASKALICARSARKKYNNSISRANGLTEKGLFGKQRNLETYYGAEESLDAQVKAIQTAKRILTPKGDVVAKEDAIAFVMMGGGGANPSDTATFVTDEKGNLMLQFHSDKTSTGDIQDNSTLKKEIDKKLEQVDGMVTRGIITDREAKRIKSIILAHAKDVEEVESTYNDGVALVSQNLIKSDNQQGASFKEQVGVIQSGAEPTILKNIDDALFGKKGVKSEAIKYLPSKYKDKDGNPKPGLNEDTIELQDKYFMIRAVAAERGGEAYNKVVVKVSKMLVSKSIREGKKPVSGIDVNNVLSFQRKKVVESHFKQFREMDKTTVNYRGKKMGLGTYLQGIDVVDSFHLKMMDGDTRNYEQGKPGSLVFSTLDVNMGGTVVNGDVLKSCFGVSSSREFLQNFSVQEKATLTYEFNEKQAIAKLSNAGIKKPTPEQIADARNVTGMNVFTYAIDKKSKQKTDVGYKTYRPKTGKSGRTNTTMQYSPAMQECFKSKNK